MATPFQALASVPEVLERVRYTSNLEAQNQSLVAENLKLKAQSQESGEADLIARKICAGFGFWAVVNFVSTGTIYPLVTGCLFFYAAINHKEVSNEKVIDPIVPVAPVR